MQTTIVAVILLLTSLTGVGAISLWAASSSLHWFLRSAVLVLTLSMLLVIPAYEPFVAFSLQAAVIALGLQVLKRRPPSENGQRSWRHRTLFTLSTGLLMTALIAVAIAVVLRLPRLGTHAWANVVLIGVTSGLATLLGVAVGTRRLGRWWLRCALGLACSLVIAFLLSWVDAFLPAIISPWNSWPPSEEGWVAWLGDEPGGYQMFVAWASIITAIAMTHAIVAWLACGWGTDLSENRRRRHHTGWVAQSALLLLAALMAIPPAFFYFRLITPIPIPASKTSDANGWMDIVAAGRMAENSSTSSTIAFYDLASPTQLAAAVKALTPAYQRLDRGLRKEVFCPLEYSQEDLDVEAITHQRTLARAVAGRGRLAEIEQRFQDAADSYLQIVRFGFAARRGGLMVDSLVGTACAGVGRARLYDCHEQLPPSDCLAIASALEQMEQQAEPAATFVYRDRIWEQHAFGWHGHLQQIIDDIAPSDLGFGTAGFVDMCVRERAEMRLLRTTLAIHAWRVTTGDLPDSLDQLVPKYLNEIPIDPMSPNRTRLRYKRGDDSYLLYSVGYDGVDDGGEPLQDDDFSMTGDLRLDRASVVPEQE